MVERTSRTAREIREEAAPTAEASLDSWKEIAAYLKRDVAKVRRWEKHEGLPVHRHHHLSRSSVYAYPSQLDAWRANRRPLAESRHSTWWRPVPAFASVITLALALMTVGSDAQMGGSAQAAEPRFQRIEVPTGLDSISATFARRQQAGLRLRWLRRRGLGRPRARESLSRHRG